MRQRLQVPHELIEVDLGAGTHKLPEGRHAPAKVKTFVELAVSRLWENRLLN